MFLLSVFLRQVFGLLVLLGRVSGPFDEALVLWAMFPVRLTSHWSCWVMFLVLGDVGSVASCLWAVGRDIGPAMSCVLSDG